MQLLLATIILIFPIYIPKRPVGWVEGGGERGGDRAEGLDVVRGRRMGLIYPTIVSMSKGKDRHEDHSKS